jgi:hypothetical protein
VLDYCLRHFLIPLVILLVAGATGH